MAGIFDLNLTYMAVPDLYYGILKINSICPFFAPPGPWCEMLYQLMIVSTSSAIFF